MIRVLRNFIGVCILVQVLRKELTQNTNLIYKDQTFDMIPSWGRFKSGCIPRMNEITLNLFSFDESLLHPVTVSLTSPFPLQLIKSILSFASLIFLQSFYIVLYSYLLCTQYLLSRLIKRKWLTSFSRTHVITRSDNSERYIVA